MDEINRAHPSRSHDEAFSLVELLVVLAIVSILAVLATPSLVSALTSGKLNTASQLVADSVALARQEAVAKDRNVQVRFYKITTGPFQGWRALQVVRVEQTSSGSSLVPVTKVRLLPDGVIASATPALSPLLTADTAISGSVSLPIYGASPYAGFYFLPSGAVESALTSANNFITLQNASAAGSPPADYSTLQINPVTGKSHHLPPMNAPFRRGYKSSSGSPAAGFVLVTVLIVLVLLVVLVVAFLLRVTTERTSSSGFHGSASARQLADMAAGLVQGQIELATAQEPTNVWTSQPGMVRTYDANGNFFNGFKLYSSTNMVVTAATGLNISGGVSPDAPTATWANDTAIWTDLNAPVQTPNGTNVYPIVDPGATNTVTGPSGFSVTSAPGATATQPIPMPVRWLYVLADGSLVAPTVPARRRRLPARIRPTRKSWAASRSGRMTTRAASTSTRPARVPIGMCRGPIRPTRRVCRSREARARSRRSGITSRCRKNSSAIRAIRP